MHLELSLPLYAMAAPAERGLGTVAVLKGLLTDDEAAVRASRAPTLTCLTGLDEGRTFPLDEACMEVGRGSQVDIRLRDRTVSRVHARLLREGDVFSIEDLDSPNGVCVNDHPIHEATVLREGDVIGLGNSRLRFQAALEASAPSEPPAPEPQQAQGAPPRAPEDRGGGRHSQWWLVGLGATLTLSLVGLLALYALQR